MTTATARDAVRTGRNSPEFPFHMIQCRRSHLPDCEHRCRDRHARHLAKPALLGQHWVEAPPPPPPPRELQPSPARRATGLRPQSCGSPTCKDPALHVQLAGHADLGAELQHQQHGQDHDDALPEQRRLEAPPEPARGDAAASGGRRPGARGHSPSGPGCRRPPARPARASTAPQSRVTGRLHPSPGTAATLPGPRAGGSGSPAPAPHPSPAR